MKNILILTFVLSCVVLIGSVTTPPLTYRNLYSNDPNRVTILQDNNGITLTLNSQANPSAVWFVFDKIKISSTQFSYYVTPTMLPTGSATNYASMGLQNTPDGQECVFPSGYWTEADNMAFAPLMGDKSVNCFTDYFSFYSNTQASSISTQTITLATATTYEWDIVNDNAANTAAHYNINVTPNPLGTNTQAKNSFYAPPMPVSLGFETYGAEAVFCIQTSEQYAVSGGNCHIPCTQTTSGACTGCMTGYTLSPGDSVCGLVVGCQTYQATSPNMMNPICSTCATNNYLSGDGTVCGTVQNCQTYTVTGKTVGSCTQCKTGFNLGLVGTAQYCGSVPGCATYSATGTCLTCTAVGYTVSGDGSTCGPVADCSTYDSNGNCQGCNPTNTAGATLYLSGDAKACGTVSSCQSYTGTVCSKCTISSGLHLSQAGDYCGKVDGCSSYTNGVCQGCQTAGYILSGDANYCGLVKYCYQYSITGVCESCQDAVTNNNVLSGDGLTCGQVVNCQVYDPVTPANCQTCTASSQTYVTGDGQACVKSNNCQSATAVTVNGVTTEVCSACVTGGSTTYYLSTTDHTCGTVQHCSSYSATGVCQECSDATNGNNYLSGDATTCGKVQDCFTYGASSAVCSKCTPSSKKFPSQDKSKCIANGCTTPGTTSLACTSCDTGLYPSAEGPDCGSVENCNKYSNGVCIECANGYILSGDAKVCGQVAGCQTYTGSMSIASCGVCRNGLFEYSVTGSNNALCGTVKECNSYTANGGCDGCENGLFASADGRTCGSVNGCQTYVGGKCHSCTGGKFLNLGATTCGAMANCLTHNAAATQCATCKSNDDPTQQGACSNVKDCSSETNGKCTECATNTNFASGDGLTCGTVENCQSYTKAGVCLKCQAGLFLSGDSQVCGSVEHCQSYSGTSSTLCATCTVSSKTFVIGDQTFCGNVRDCTEYDPLTGKCTECSNNLFASQDGKTCGQIQYCESYLAGRCVSCADDTDGESTYITGDGKTCSPVENCQSYDATNKVCQGCSLASDLILSGDGKYCGDVAQCSTYNAEGVCLECIAQSAVPHISGDQQTCGAVEDCQSYSSFGVCESCTPASELILSGDTNVCGDINNCHKYAADGTCEQCDAGLFLSGNTLHCGAVENCYAYTESGVCESCTPSSETILSGDANTCGEVEYCETYDEEGVCQSCTESSGLYLSGDANTCGAVEYCAFYVNDECQVCDDVRLLTTDRQACATPSAPTKKSLTAGEKAAICVLTIAAGLALIGTLAFVLKFKNRHLKVKTPKKGVQGGNSAVQTAHQQIVSPTTPASQ